MQVQEKLPEKVVVIIPPRRFHTVQALACAILAIWKRIDISDIEIRVDSTFNYTINDPVYVIENNFYRTRLNIAKYIWHAMFDERKYWMYFESLGIIDNYIDGLLLKDDERFSIADSIDRMDIGLMGDNQTLADRFREAADLMRYTIEHSIQRLFKYDLDM